MGIAYEAAVTGRVGQMAVEAADLPLKHADRSGHQRNARGHAGVGYDEARHEIVGAVQHDVGLRVGQKRRDIVRRDRLGDGGHRYVRIQALHGSRRRFSLGRTDIAGPVKRLALQVGQ